MAKEEEKRKNGGKHSQEIPPKRDKQNREKEENMEKQENDTMELKKENETLKIQLNETDDRLKRVAAEFDNYKKRTSKERDSMYHSVMAEIVSTLLPVIDNLEQAAYAKTEDQSYQQGVEMVLKQFKDVLMANGITQIEALGQTFNPELHEAVSLVQDENLGEKEIKEEYRKGYMINNKVIRHSMVVVAN